MFAAGAADAPVPPNVLAACVRVLTDWGWTERPVAVVAMPSRSKPQLVRTLARGIADVGRLPMLGALDLVDGGPTGGPGGNNAFRLAGVWGGSVPRVSMLRPDPCCWSTTSSTAGGR
jgi:ATP-dependent DNA helicase RecQ